MSPETFAVCLQRCGVCPEDRVLAAVSGGADSMCLLELLCRLRETFPLKVVCAHAEHGLRGEDSLEDERFVRRFCGDREVPFYSRSLPVRAFAKEKGIGIEEAARELRYAFLRETAETTGCAFIATAHHQMDQAETLLMRLGRGTDLRGLAGMRMRSGNHIRPFLETPPEDLRDYLRGEGISWREDESNADTAYARNRIRAAVLPELTALYPGAAGAIARFSQAAARDEDYFAQELLARGLGSPEPLADGAALLRSAFLGVHPALAGRAIRGLLEAAGAELDRRTIETAAQAARLPDGRLTLNLPEDGRLTIGKDTVAAVFPRREIPCVPLAPGRNETLFGEFVLEPANGKTGDGKRTQAIPEVEAPFLSVGVREEGETMIPFGRQRETSLAGIIKNAGIEAPLRRSVPVIRGKIGVLWVAGVRAADGCRCNGEGNWLLTWVNPVHGLLSPWQ